VPPKGDHSSDFIIKGLQLYMILPTSWSAPETCSGSMMCSWSLSFWATNFLLLLSGTTYWNCTKSTIPDCVVSCASCQDTHLNPAAQISTKVNLAAQVMSHTVAAGINTLVGTGKDHCIVCHELYPLMTEVANENNGG
jgi:hypothetical protein